MSEPAGFPGGRTFVEIFGKKPSSTRIRQVNLRKLFPPNDEYATCMARLCILREDLSLEVTGIVAGPFDGLDGNSIAWRHNYFFRNSSKTLQEISRAIQQLRGMPEFQRAVKKRFTAVQKEDFDKFCKDLQTSRDIVTQVRNAIGAHVNYSMVGRGLETLNFDNTGFWERPFNQSDRVAHTHYRFVNELFIGILRAREPTEDLPPRDITEVLEIGQVMARLITAIPYIDSLFELYVEERHLL